MTTLQIFYLAIIFIGVFGAALAVLFFFVPSPVRDRLQNVMNSNTGTKAAPMPSNWVEKAAKYTSPLAKLSLPEDGWEKSPLRLRFMNAGFRGMTAPMVFFGAKTLLAIGLPFLVYLTIAISGKAYDTNTTLFFLLVGAAIGYYLPNFVLNRIIAIRQREVTDNFPDALDLLTVCVEAGLAIDASLARVADEMRVKTPTLSTELHLVTLELRAGVSKEKALRNLAMRTGVEDVDTLVAMLVQAEKFGTSVADSLRIHSESLRTKRRQRAEEEAAKIALKLLFPLIFFIFPSLLLVLLGPAFIQIIRVLLPTMSGQ
jgi:tight adherence protein C